MSNNCRKRRELTLVEGKGKEVEEREQTDSDEEYDDEVMPNEGHQLSCLIHRNFHAPRNPDFSQRTNLFHTRCTINGKSAMAVQAI